jgi:hypothetical protein
MSAMYSPQLSAEYARPERRRYTKDALAPLERCSHSLSSGRGRVGL